MYFDALGCRGVSWGVVGCHGVISSTANGIVGFYSAILRSKNADRITNRVDTDKTAP